MNAGRRVLPSAYPYKSAAMRSAAICKSGRRCKAFSYRKVCGRLHSGASKVKCLFSPFTVAL